MCCCTTPVHRTSIHNYSHRPIHSQTPNKLHEQIMFYALLAFSNLDEMTLQKDTHCTMIYVLRHMHVHRQRAKMRTPATNCENATHGQTQNTRTHLCTRAFARIYKYTRWHHSFRIIPWDETLAIRLNHRFGRADCLANAAQTRTCPGVFSSLCVRVSNRQASRVILGREHERSQHRRFVEPQTETRRQYLSGTVVDTRNG